MSQQLWVSPKSFPFKVLVLQNILNILRAFAKSRKGNTNFVIYVCLSVCSSVRPSVRSSVLFRREKLGPHWMNFHEIWYFRTLKKKSVQKIQVSLKFDKNEEFCSWRLTYIRDIISVTLPLEREIFLTNFQKNSKRTFYDYILITNLTHWLLFIHKILFSSTCFEPQVLICRRIQLYTCSLWYCHSIRVWQYHMLHVYNSILLQMSTWGLKHVEENNIWWMNYNQCINLVINI